MSQDDFEEKVDHGMACWRCGKDLSGDVVSICTDTEKHRYVCQECAGKLLRWSKKMITGEQRRAEKLEQERDEARDECERLKEIVEDDDRNKEVAEQLLVDFENGPIARQHESALYLLRKAESELDLFRRLDLGWIETSLRLSETGQVGTMSNMKCEEQIEVIRDLQKMSRKNGLSE